MSEGKISHFDLECKPTCNYQSKKCLKECYKKSNGQYAKLCEFHGELFRARQRDYDQKKRDEKQHVKRKRCYHDTLTEYKDPQNYNVRSQDSKNVVHNQQDCSDISYKDAHSSGVSLGSTMHQNTHAFPHMGLKVESVDNSLEEYEIEPIPLSEPTIPLTNKDCESVAYILDNTPTSGVAEIMEPMDDNSLAYFDLQLHDQKVWLNESDLEVLTEFTKRQKRAVNSQSFLKFVTNNMNVYAKTPEDFPNLLSGTIIPQDVNGEMICSYAQTKIKCNKPTYIKRNGKHAKLCWGHGKMMRDNQRRWDAKQREKKASMPRKRRNHDILHFSQTKESNDVKPRTSDTNFDHSNNFSVSKSKRTSTASSANQQALKVSSQVYITDEEGNEVSNFNETPLDFPPVIVSEVDSREILSIYANNPEPLYENHNSHEKFLWSNTNNKICDDVFLGNDQSQCAAMTTDIDHKHTASTTMLTVDGSLASNDWDESYAMELLSDSDSVELDETDVETLKRILHL